MVRVDPLPDEAEGVLVGQTHGLFGQRGKRWRFWPTIPRVSFLANETMDVLVAQSHGLFGSFLTNKDECVLVDEHGWNFWSTMQRVAFLVNGAEGGVFGQHYQGWLVWPMRPRVPSLTNGLFGQRG